MKTAVKREVPKFEGTEPPAGIRTKAFKPTTKFGWCIDGTDERCPVTRVVTSEFVGYKIGDIRKCGCDCHN